MLPRPWAHVDHVIGDLDGLLVVLHHDDRVAKITKPHQGPDQALVVALVQADRWLVQHVKHAHQPAADLAGQADPLGFAPRKGGCRTSQGQIVEPHIEEELHPLADLAEDPVGDHVVSVRQVQRPDDLDGPSDGQ